MKRVLLVPALLLLASAVLAQPVNIVGRDVVAERSLLTQAATEDIVFSNGGTGLKSQLPMQASACSVYAVVVPGQTYTFKIEGIDDEWAAQTKWETLTPRTSGRYTHSLGGILWSRINKVSSNIAVTSDVTIGTSSAASAVARVDTTTKLAYIPAGLAETINAVSSVPKGRQLEISSWELSAVFSNWTSPAVTRDSSQVVGSLWTRKILLDAAKPDTAWRLLDYLTVLPKYGPSIATFPDPIIIPEMSDVVVRAAVQGKPVEVLTRVGGRIRSN